MFKSKHCPSGEKCKMPGTAKAWYWTKEDLNSCGRLYVSMRRLFTNNQRKEIMMGNLLKGKGEEMLGLWGN